MKRYVIAIGLVLALVGGVSAYGQGSSGTIQVTVVAQDGSRLPGVTVTAESVEALGTRVAITDAQGVATMPGLTPSTKWVVTSTLEGFSGARNENVLVRAGQTTSLNVTLSLGAVEEELIVTAESPIVDVTSAVTGQDITLELTESLPTNRSYQSYLQLVPGVLPTDPTNRSENPAARSGLNYSDIAGELGISRDNFYYLEGINVTDPVTGTFGANVNTEIIQEQSVLTGGIPAEFIGAPGLVSNVVTKSGGNDFAGSLNYYFQNDSLVATNKNAADSKFSTYDTAFTIGGPIVRDKAWFFGSYRLTNREEDVITLDTNTFARTVTEDSKQGFGKLSWAPTASIKVTGTYLSDPEDRDGSFERDRLNNRDFSREAGGDRYIISYSQVFGSFFADISAGRHNGEVSTFATVQDPSNTVLFQTTDARTLQDEQLGGFGNNQIDQRDNEFVKLSGSWFVGSGFGDHTIKGGYERQEHINFRDRVIPGMATYESLAGKYIGAGITAGEVSNGSWTSLAFDPFNVSDFGGFINTVNSSANRDAIYAAFDSNGDGTLSAEEVAANLKYTSTNGNPDGLLNYDRTLQAALGPQETKSKGDTVYLQDTLQTNRFTFNVGVRAERYRHFATTGEEIFTFDWEYAPRISVVYDLLGNGKQKVSAYYGRYYDPIRNNLTNFAGTLTGSILEEQVYVAPIEQWVTYRTRGGPQVQDAFFAPTTKTPYTDDLQIGYQIDLGNSMSLEANYINRKTRDIIEDYDLALYALATDGSTDYPGPINDPNSLWLGLDYFGYDVNPGSNFVIATLEGGKRDRDELELVFRKRYSNNWQALVSYNYADGEGNTNSDSNADFQGDVLFLDPRAPNQLGRQPGLIEHLFKAVGSYRFNNGIQIGGAYRWNSGTVASRTFLASRRNLPIRVSSADSFEYAGITQRWLAPDAVGTLTNPSWDQLDLRLQYNHNFGRLETEFFIDVFNVFDEQSAVRNQDLVAGTGDIQFGDPISWVAPRRYFLGARVSF